MDFKQIKTIIKDFENSNITNLEIEMDNFKIKLNKNQTDDVQLTKVVEKVAAQEEVINEPVKTSGFEVKSPLVGTFYAANSPEDEPFVKVGQKVEKGDTLCIIEAMKIMNEITAPVSGEISAIYVNNGDAVGFDQVIITII